MVHVKKGLQMMRDELLVLGSKEWTALWLKEGVGGGPGAPVTTDGRWF